MNIEATDSKLFFVCGCSRSGTTTFADFLRSNDHIAMGRERYGKRLRLQQFLTHDLFEKKRFCCQLEEGDSHHAVLDPYYLSLFDRFDECSIVGDKIPRLYEHFEHIGDVFPDAKIFFLVRNINQVADSFEVRSQHSKQNPDSPWPANRDGFAAVDEWNQSLDSVAEYFDRLNIMIIDFDSLYRDKALVTKSTSFLEVPIVDKMHDFWQQASIRRSQIDKRPRAALSKSHFEYIDKHANFSAYKHVLQLSKF